MLTVLAATLILGADPPSAARLRELKCIVRDPHSDPKLAYDAVETLSRFDSAIPALVDATGHSDRTVREAAADVVVRKACEKDDFDPFEAPSEHDILMVATILRLTKSPLAHVRRRAFVGLVYFCEDGRPEVLLGLRDPDRETRAYLCSALQRRGPVASAAIVPLIERLTDEDPSVRIAAARALWAIERRADRILPVLLPLLHHQKSDVRVGAAMLLSTMGPQAAGAVPTLTRLGSTDPDADVRHIAAYALREIAPTVLR